MAADFLSKVDAATLPVNNGLRAGSYQISGTYVGTTKDAVVKILTIRSNTKTSLSLERRTQAFLGTPANVRLQVRGFDGAAPTGTFIVYRNNKPFARRFTNSYGRASIPVPANLGVGMQSFTVRFLPRDNHYLTSRAGSSLLSVTEGTTSATMSLSSRVVVDHRARMTLQVRAARGPATGNVTIKSGPELLAVRRLDSRGMSFLDLPAYSSGTYTITVVFAGNAALKGSSVQRKMTIVRAAPKISVSAKAAGSSVRISSAVSGSYGSPTSRATVYLDGHAKTTVPASGGSVTVASLAAGRHVVNVQYPGDVRWWHSLPPGQPERRVARLRPPVLGVRPVLLEGAGRRRRRPGLRQRAVLTGRQYSALLGRHIGCQKRPETPAEVRFCVSAVQPPGSSPSHGFSLTGQPVSSDIGSR